MPASIGEFTQQYITKTDDRTDAEVAIETDGKQIRPIVTLLSHLVDELRLHVTEDGLWSSHADPANVGMANLHVYPAAFEQYDLDGEAFEVGLHIETLRKAVKDARKTHRDPVSIQLNDRRTLVTISREYENGPVEWSDRLVNIDADSIRKDPDVSSDKIRSLAEWEARVEVGALHDALAHLKKTTDHLSLLEDNGHLIAHAARRGDEGPLPVGSDGADDTNFGGTSASAIDFGAVAEPTKDGGEKGASSLFSLTYLLAQASGLKKADVDEVTLVWGEQVPGGIIFERTAADDDDTLLMEGELFTAPRIKSEDS